MARGDLVADLDLDRDAPDAGESPGLLQAFERGERVYLAMVSRGYQGSIPPGPASVATTAAIGWTTLGLACVWGVAVTAMIIT